MADLKEVVNRVLLPVQLCLGLFQIMKTTPLWAVIHCALASLLNFFHFPHTDYKHLGNFKGRVFKKVISHTTTAGTKPRKQKDSEKTKKEGESSGAKPEKQKDSEKTKKEGKSEDSEKTKNEGKSEDSEKAQTEGESDDHEQSKKEGKSEDPKKTQTEGESGDQKQSKKEGALEDRKQFKKEVANVKYLGKEFVLHRSDENKMLMTDGPAYYITDKMWETVKYIEKVASRTVFLKDNKEIWEEVVTGDIMEFKQVLDSVILDNRAIIRLDNDYFLPVNLLRSHMMLVTTLNFVGLFLKTQNHIHWLIPALLTFASVIMGFSTILRLWIDRLINRIVCKSVQLLYDLLPSETRRRAYSLGNWVENLKPGNDLKSKIVRGTAILLVTAGANLDSKSFADLEPLDDRDPYTRVLVGGGAEIDTESFSDSINVVVSGDAKSDLETSTDCQSLARLVIMAESSNIRTFLTGGKKVQPDLSGDFFKQFPNDSEEWVRDVWPQVGPFLFKCDSVYIEWIFDNTNQICSLKAGRVAASGESLKARDVCIVICNDHAKDYYTRKNDVRPLTFGGKEHNKSLIADDFSTSSIDVECSSSVEAIKLLKFAFYMAKYRTTSLKSYDHKKNKVTVRRFVESINAYASSGYPPLRKLIMHDVVVR